MGAKMTLFEKKFFLERLNIHIFLFQTFQTIGQPVTRTKNKIQVSKQRNFCEKFCRSNVRSD